MNGEPDDGFALDADGLAGVVDLYGALSREEIRRAVHELAFKRGVDPESVAVDDTVDDAVDSYHLVPVETDGETRYVVGPVAFPTLPPGASDLPHILDVDERPVDRERIAADVEARLRADAARAVADGDDDRVLDLLDVTYDLEAWAPVDVSRVRDQLDAARDDDRDGEND